ncbi:hypothetical protein [Allopusillimonas ginsengisoli]|uniref:hypothetical protein n=1 Tax=Allopusillimonas ginsengisoli TaxID=453575 RepID=UPI00101FDA2E|nr:hypothetical protein [Allopusillimonas ginsengisoli]TEA78927.1 hypothetical protein ERE07_05885 [Allopusillimonas ginsengisoli]
MEPVLLPHASATEAFTHIRIIIGMVLGLCISRLLIGVAGLLQHRKPGIIYPTHLCWVAFALLSVVHFWWFEFNLRTLPVWTFQIYVFVIFYAGLYFLLSAMLFPGDMEEYAGYRDYFMSRRAWFFGFMVLIYLADIVDTLIKGWDHYAVYGIEYPLQVTAFIVLSLVGIWTRSAGFHRAFAILALVYQVTYTVRHFYVLT